MKSVYLGGEGPTELGDWYREQAYQPRPGDPCEDGVLVAILRRMELPHSVDGACRWSKVRKFRAARGKPPPPETQTVLGLALAASEAGCSVLAFVRDREGDQEREQQLENGIDEARQLFGEVRIVGGTANQEIEAWILGLLDDRRAEQVARPKEHLASTHDITTTIDKCVVIAEADLAAPHPHAPSLTRWLERAREAWR